MGGLAGGPDRPPDPARRLAPAADPARLDNLTGHKTPELLCWFFAHGVLPLYTPLGGSWLNKAESIQRILARRALKGHQATTPRRPSRS